MIDFEDVWFARKQRQVLKGVSFSVKSSERMAILGGSGSGKTTILRLIMGLLKPDRGSIRIDGEEISTMSEAQLRGVRLNFSIVFQEGALFDSLTVKENVAFLLREYTSASEKQIDERVRELLRTVDMEEAIMMMPEELSGGMQRRAAIARSLAARDPRMFLYDEPTAGLDPINAQKIVGIIDELCTSGGRGMVLVTHELLHAIRMADRYLFLDDGKVVFEGDQPSLVRSRVGPLRRFMEDYEAMAQLRDGKPEGLSA
jgi:phospholipid/cholesterol/gamma-HCH transport system ATP-binding protein